jgi:hypothetical protein
VIAGWYGPGPGFELQIQWSAGEIPGFANELNLGLPKACKVTSVVVLPKKKKKKKGKLLARLREKLRNWVRFSFFLC